MLQTQLHHCTAGPASVSFQLALDTTTTPISVGVQGTFSAALRVPGVRNPVGMSVTAGFGAGATGVRAALGAKITSPVVFEHLR